ncbi:peptidoglycan-binding domain-containing protein, partial [Rhodopseudomonas palustris]
MNRWIVALGFLLVPSLPAVAADLTPDMINAASFSGEIPKVDDISPLAVKVQVLLDRVRFSPGQIDGRFGENVEKALSAFATFNQLPPGKALTPEIWSRLQAVADDAVVTSYSISQDDLKGPFLKSIPAQMEDMKSLDHLGYTGPKEELAERFHMSPELLSALNPGQNFDHAGDSINVIDISVD